MRDQSLKKPSYESQWLTTADVARALERTTRGARWIAEQYALTCQRTQGGQRLYKEADVRELADRRARARLHGVKVLRPKRFNVRGEPQQMSLFGPRRVENG